MRWVALLAALVFAGTAGVVMASTAQAAPRPPLTGVDVSWPNCPKGMGIPSRRSEGKPMPATTTGFVVIGLTNGPGFYANPCLASQAAWARSHHRLTGMYAMTTYPTAAQLTTYGRKGPWKGNDLSSRLANAGYAEARFNLDHARAAGLTNRFVWIDVEDYRWAPWGGTVSNRRAVLNGVIKGYRDAGVSVGTYSIKSMWDRITGSWRVTMPLWDSVGGTSARAAAARCTAPTFTGGPRVLVQWWDPRQDHDLTCPGVTGTTATPSPLAPYRSTTLRQGSRGTAVAALQRRLGVTPTGYFGPVTRSAVTSFQRAHHLAATGVVGQAEWRALGASEVTPGRPGTMARYFTRY